jgi:hypothetical protein
MRLVKTAGLTVLLAASILFPLCAVEGEPDFSMGILDDGPHKSTGSLFLGPNVLPFVYAYYEWGPSQVYVEYTSENIVLDESWKDGKCGRYEVRYRTFKQDTVFAFNGDAWTVFLRFSNEAESYCSFFTVFLNRLQFFIEVTNSDYDVPFPAILNIQL